MPQVLKSRPPSGTSRGRKRKLLRGEDVKEEAGESAVGELWVEKHAPRTASDLVVHGKKVNDVRRWFSSRLQGEEGGHCLLLAGPAGVGKSAVVRVLGSELGVEFCEWKTPTPTPWAEHVHHGFTGHRYTSKLDEFAIFVEAARKFPVLPVSGFTSAKTAVKTLLVEDLPHVNDAAQTHHLCSLLRTLARSACFITVVVMTDVVDDSKNARFRAHREAQQTLESAGATKIVFNPVTANAIKRLLTKVAATEKCTLSSDYIAAIAENCGGDLRHAISSLQFQCTGQRSRSAREKESFEFGSGRTFASDDDGVTLRGSGFESGTSSSPTYGRDNVFSLYHALGKFLHNKRQTDQPVEGDQESLVVLSERYRRHPLNMEVPERILSEAQIEFPTLAAFLHENLLDFVDEDAVDDVADALTFLGDADILLSGSSSSSSSSSSASSLTDVTGSHVATFAAGSVAARGVLFANTHPAPRKWQSVRAPMLWQVDRLLSEKKESRFQAGAALPRQVSWEVPSRCIPDPLPDSEDEPMDDIRSLTADCIVDLDSLEDLDDDIPHSSNTNTQEQVQMVHVDRRRLNRTLFEDDMEEDEDIIEDDDEDA